LQRRGHRGRPLPRQPRATIPADRPADPPAHTVVESLTNDSGLGPAAAGVLVLRLAKQPAAAPWRTAVALGFLQRHPTPSATAAVLRFATETSVPWQRELALDLTRSFRDPALAQKVAVERARHRAAGRTLPPEVAALG
jgi:hypothetical protein